MQVSIFRAGSAGGPKPGRAGFYLELARHVHLRMNGREGGVTKVTT